MDAKIINKYKDIDSVCSKCAQSIGFVPKDKVVGVWMGECELCHEFKPCTNLWHDWMFVENLNETT
jgi:hypothetical protein